MTEIKTDREHLVEVRNKIAGRIVENKANAEYWSYVARHSPQNSQKIVNARESVKINEESIKKDILFLRCIDLMLKGMK